MALEAFGNNISTLVATNPTGADAKSTADDHIRGVKSVLLAQFPALTAPITPTHTELNFVDGVTSAIQTQIDNKAPIASPTFTGTPAAPTATLGTNTTQLATMAAVQAAIANVNAQTATVVAVVSGTSQAAVAGSHYILTNVAATTVALPAILSIGETVWITWTNTLATNVVARTGGNTIMGLAESMTLDASTNGTAQLRAVSASDWRIV